MTDDHAACVALWRAVISQRLCDATGARFDGDNIKHWPRLRAEAQAWFLNPADDFEPTCEAAEIGASQMRRFAIQKIEAFNAQRTAA